MRVSEYYKLGRKQPELSFVDVNLLGDVKLYISPRAVRSTPDDMSNKCASLVQSFFGTVLTLIRSGQDSDAIRLLERLGEPNETHLGQSKGPSRGRGLGSRKARGIWKSFAKSKAVTSGLLKDLEDTVLMIEGVSLDIISDVMTNIIRGPLIEYTQSTCRQYGIPLTPDVASGPLWDPQKLSWTDSYVYLPTPNNEKLLLVPKAIVRLDMDYDVDKYYRNYILEYLKDEEEKKNSELVDVIKSGPRAGEKRVLIKDLKDKFGTGKPAILEQTLKNPQLLEQYRADNNTPSKPLTHREIADAEDSEGPDWDHLLNTVMTLPVGKESAHGYELAVEALLSALFYPALSSPQFQEKIHQGRKRIDISYTNSASDGFFRWLSLHYSSAYIHFECKNYGKEIANPELDQISGRFSPNRGKFGIIVCREFANKDRFADRCRDTAVDQRGFVIALDDADLRELTMARKKGHDFFELPLLKKRFTALVN